MADEDNDGKPRYGGSGEGSGPEGPERRRTLPRTPVRPDAPGGGILMGRPFGVPVYVAPSWFLVAILITWVFGGQLDRVLPELGAVRYLIALFFAVAFYASVLVHELAHTVAALRFKLPVRRIQLQSSSSAASPRSRRSPRPPAGNSSSPSWGPCSPSSWPVSSTPRCAPWNPAPCPGCCWPA